MATVPEIKGDKWFNTKPLSTADLRGHPLVIDFWTYSCVNCIRTLPHIKKLWEKYKKYGLIIIGIHTPEFDFEKDNKNVAAAIKKFKLKHPIVTDPNHDMFRAFRNSYWPRQYLVDQEGYIVYDHIGEGGEEELEERIQSLLTKNNKSLPPLETPKNKKGFFGKFMVTPETYAGATRNTGLGNSAVCVKGSCTNFVDPGKHLPDTIYLQGDWIPEDEYLHKATKREGHILLKYTAKEANLVMSAEKKIKAEVLLDDKPIPKTLAGEDIKVKGKATYVTVGAPRMYKLISSEKLESHELKIKTKEKGLKVFAYTFG